MATRDVLKSEAGGAWYAEARDWTTADPHAVVRIGVDKKRIKELGKRGQTWTIGQLYGVVKTGLISATHVFQGARRPMHVDGNHEADRDVLFFTWRAPRDARMAWDGKEWVLDFTPSEPSTVFFVKTTPNSGSEFPEIHSWAREWGWLDADPVMSGAPARWAEKYDCRLGYDRL